MSIDSLPQTPLQITNQAPANKTPKNMKAIDKAAKEYEAVFLTEMLGHMWKGIKTDGPFGGGNAEETYRSLMLQEYGKAIANNGGIGIAPAMKKEMIRLQEGQ